MRKYSLIIITVSLIIVCFGFATRISLHSIDQVVESNNEEFATVFAEKVYYDINEDLERSVSVGQTIAHSDFLIDFLSNEEMYSDEEVESRLQKYLQHIADTFSYSTAFVVSEKSKRYYTQEGFNKVVDPSKDTHDIWYDTFLEKNKNYDFDIDIDQMNYGNWTVFLNNRITDSHGNLLGVCGVGFEMKSMQDALWGIQEKYGVSISLVDRNGLVQVDVDDLNIENRVLSTIDLDNVSGDYEYEAIKNGYLISKYMEDFGWFLVIQKEDNKTQQIYADLVAQNIMAMMIIVGVLILVIIWLVTKGNSKLAEAVKLRSYGSLASVYGGMYIIDLEEDRIDAVKSIFQEKEHYFRSEISAKMQMPQMVENWVVPEYKAIMRDFLDLSTVVERLEDKDTIAMEFIAERLGWIRARFIAEDNHRDQYTTHVIFALELIDEEKRDQEAMRQEMLEARLASEAKGRFLANMSHEIRTPINAILGMDTMILRESAETKIKEYAMDIKNAGQILLSLINDILDVSKIESGKMEIVPVKYELSSLIYDVVNMVSEKAKAKNLQLNLDIDKTMPAGLFGDDVRIRQIILNLLNNAVKYTEKGSVTLQVWGEKDGPDEILHVSVKDTGIGIKEVDMKKLFADFERIDTEKNRHIEGTGLGMSITKQLLELMDSSLQVKSVYGEGSEFSFAIRQIIDAEEEIGDISGRIAARAESYSYEAAFIAPDANVLVVDDNAINRSVFINLLKDTEIQIEEASGGFDALDKIQAKKYDIIFLDHMMPDMDGITVMKKVHEMDEHPNVDTPIIILTANAVTGARENYLEEGFHDYLSKPIIPEKLEKMIKNYLPQELIKEVQGKKAKKSTPVGEDLPSIEGLDWNYGLLHLSDQDMLLGTIKTFYDTLISDADTLEELYLKIKEGINLEEMIDQFRIKVHAMKSVANLIGAVPIAGMAASLEFAARDNDIASIIDVTPHFLNSYRKYRQKLEILFPTKNEMTKKEIHDKTEIVDYIEQLIFAIGSFDVHGADAALAHLKEFAHGEKETALLDKIAVAVTNLDTAQVEELGKELMQYYTE